MDLKYACHLKASEQQERNKAQHKLAVPIASIQKEGFSGRILMVTTSYSTHDETTFSSPAGSTSAGRHSLPAA